MNNKGNALCSVLILILGGVFVWLHDHGSLTRTVVMLCGLAFVIPAVINLLALFIAGKRHTVSAGMRLVQMFCGVGGLALGLCIALMPDAFRGLLPYLFGLLMFFGGAFQIFQISYKSRPVDYPSWQYIIPVLTIITGVVLFTVPWLHDVANERWMLLLTGIIFALFGFNGLCITINTHRLPRLHPEADAAREAAKVAKKAQDYADTAKAEAKEAQRELKRSEQARKDADEVRAKIDAGAAADAPEADGPGADLRSSDASVPRSPEEE